MNKSFSFLLFIMLMSLQNLYAQEYATEAYLKRIRNLFFRELSFGLFSRSMTRTGKRHRSGKNHILALKPLVMPLKENAVCFSSICAVDEHISKEALYKAALSWYLASFPFAHQNLIIEDQIKGKILSRCSYSFKDPDQDDESIRMNFLVELSVRYKRCQLRMYDIQTRYEGPWKNPQTGKEQHLDEVYEHYRVYPPSRPAYDLELRQIQHYFNDRIGSFLKNIEELTSFGLKKDF